MPLRGARSSRGRKRFGGTGRRKYSTKGKKGGIYSRRKAVRSANTVRKIARKAARNVIRDTRPVLHRKFNLDANQGGGYETLVHNQWQFYFCDPHIHGQCYTGGLCELAGQDNGHWPVEPQLLDGMNNTTRLIPLCEEPGAVPGNFRSAKYIEGGYVHGKITFSQYPDRCAGRVRIMVIMYQQGLALSMDDVILQTNCVAGTALPPQNLFDAPQRPRKYRQKRMRILQDFVTYLKPEGGFLFGGPTAIPGAASQINGQKSVSFKVKLPKKFYYDAIDSVAPQYDPTTCEPSKWNVGFAVCAYGGNTVPAATNICQMTFKGDLTWRNPLV